MDALLDKLVQSPLLPRYLAELKSVLAEEQARRERFVERMDEGVKQEFINGKVVVSSPVRLEHEQASSRLFRLLSAYVEAHDLGFVGHEKLMISLQRNDYEPDVAYWRTEKARAFTPKQTRFPAPDFIAEVLSETTEANDRGVKFEDYATHGVAEYWIVDAAAESIEQYLLDGDAYRLKTRADAGELNSSAVAGFSIPVRAVFDKSEFLNQMRRLVQG